jgi:N utilization substance protein B
MIKVQKNPNVIPAKAGTEKKSFSFPARRRHARQTVMQALYQWEINKSDISTIEKQFESKEHFQTVDAEYFKEILHGVILELEVIDHYIKRYIDRDISELDPVELTVARVAVYEFLKRLDVPYKVVLNEALESAKKFGAQEGHKFINGILDKIAREVRHTEIKS